jgi:16S rRNA (adenine1518-N6/adenine1519-N6)-dimethyltransferase
MSSQNLLSIKSIIGKHGLSPKKNLGQNFLLDLNITNKIVSAAQVKTGEEVLEIGPGPGGLTRSILAKNPSKLVVIEQDKRCVVALEELKLTYPQLVIINDDALLVKEEDLVPIKTKIIANLPYNISTVLLLKWLNQRNYWQSMTLMFQKEVADRIMAMPGNKNYGRLSVIARLICQVEWHFDLKPECFFPPPKVTSSVISLYPKPNQLDKEVINTVEKICKILFNQRRKMLRATLKQVHPNLEALLDNSGVYLTQRPEEISVESFIIIAKNYLSLKAS